MLVVTQHEINKRNKWGQRVLSSDYLSELLQLPHNTGENVPLVLFLPCWSCLVTQSFIAHCLLLWVSTKKIL